VTTAVRDDGARRKVYAFLEDEMKEGRQVYVVFPQVEETEESDLRAATEGCEQLRKRFPTLRVGLVHGRLSRTDRDAVMSAFRGGDLDLLVATTVIEVGVDVPNATVMVVEHAERFGLSQLHQLRGRVGRGHEKSWCILMRAKRATPEAEMRLAAMEDSSDGFRIAEVDLEIRGPGEFFGTRQSGMPPLRAANLIRDRALLQQARDEAFQLLERDRLPPPLDAWLRNYWGERYGLIEVG
jgi:ATP-dependent DNA helicase RecG